MAWELVADPKHKYRGEVFVSVDPKRKRMGLYKEARKMMLDNYGKEFEFVQIFRDSDFSDRFWIKPCDEHDEGSRKLDAPSPSTRTLSVSLLLQQLEWAPKKTVRLPITWDEDNKAALVNITEVVR